MRRRWFFIFWETAKAESPGKGNPPRVTSSQTSTPKLQTSEACVSRPSRSVSGAIQRTGSPSIAV